VGGRNKERGNEERQWTKKARPLCPSAGGVAREEFFVLEGVKVVLETT
jgi:hypothetical protein